MESQKPPARPPERCCKYMGFPLFLVIFARHEASMRALEKERMKRNDRERQGQHRGCRRKRAPSSYPKSLSINCKLGASCQMVEPPYCGRPMQRKALAALLVSFLFSSGVIRASSSIACMLSHMAAWIGNARYRVLHSRFVSCTAPCRFWYAHRRKSRTMPLRKPVCHVRPMLFPPGSICVVALR